jgi:DNA-3-methyladenine glycosylase II
LARKAANHEDHGHLTAEECLCRHKHSHIPRGASIVGGVSHGPRAIGFHRAQQGDSVQVMKLIQSQADVDAGADWLSAQCPRLAFAYRQTGPLPLRLREDGFGALLQAIVGQQVSTASAAAIWSRLEHASLTTPDEVVAASEEDLRAAGLSRPKARYAKALAEAQIDFAALHGMPSEAVVAQLTQVKGIGIWTAEIYAMFSLGRADVFAPGDLALQEAARLLYDLPDRPSEKALRARAEDWSPWRAVAARLLFAYYRVAKGREGIT